MTETTGTADRRLRDVSFQIAAVRRELELRDDVANLAPLGEFAEIFLGRGSEAFLRGHDVSALTSQTLGAYRFLEQSRPDQVDVQVLTQTDADGRDATTIVRASVSERPFIVDTIRELLHSRDLTIEHMVYPMLDVERDASGAVQHVRPPSDSGAKESLVHCELESVSDPETLAWIETEVRRHLQDVIRATDDFGPMIATLEKVAAELSPHAGDRSARAADVAEVQDFLRWLGGGGFVFLGARAYDLVMDASGERCVAVEPGSGLGVLRNEAESRYAEPVPLSQLPQAQRELAESGPLLIISKTNAVATVHRRARMDYIGVKKLDADGRSIGEHRFLGLFTSKAYSEAAENIPILRRKLERILARSGVRKGSHDYKAIITIFGTLPREGLFVSSDEEIGRDIETILTAFSTEDVTVTLRDDPLQRGVSVMVILPRNRFSAEVRQDIEIALVAAFEAEVLNYHLALGEGDQARLHFHLAASDARVQAADTAALEHEIAGLIRTWSDLVEDGLEGVRPADVARSMAAEYGAALSLEYQAATTPSVAVEDILRLEEMAERETSISVTLANRAPSETTAGMEGATELKVFRRGERLILSDFMPILEDLGLRVLAMKPFEVRGADAGDATIYAFAVQDPEGRVLDVDGRGHLVSETVLAAWSGDAVSDPLNALAVSAGLHWREVDVLRALAGYAFQSGAVPSRVAVPTALVKHPQVAGLLFDHFRAKFDPATEAPLETRTAAIRDLRAALQEALDAVSLLADDRVLRSMEELLCSTVRTNYYRRGGAAPNFRSGGVPFVSFKILVGDIVHSAPTELLFEVWVHSSRMEGVHLRGSTVARGGIRWSDRPDDFRTEVLGLVKTQMVKNAVIVPGGSKGGFVTRRTPSDPEERFEEGRNQYQTLMRGLLDITDNRREGSPEPAEGVVAYDPPDPYLVVAADKGTATFSDLANGVAGEYGFWLDDAFASGGSNGYDHKAVGITARGGWECVKRHFRERGKDIQAEPFTVAGIGDMSGDVFGNGMLLSEQIRLVAAFDHRHVFIDPDPDPARSHAERTRLFEVGRSSWDDYDRATMSAGGMIIPRGAKEVELTPEAREVLGISEEDAKDLDGESLIRCVLRAPVELLWNGGIGTYVKASEETDADAGDPANDAVRVDANELRCQVVGEGGNLGFTQAGRVEYALLGGRLNTDALDNSGGVDMSDHEVNLKILMAPAVTSGAMDPEKRNRVLEDLTEPVAELVLRNNRSQSLAISLDEQRARESADDFRDLMFWLEKDSGLDRASEGLPSRDVLAERAALGQSILVRPELCVLLAYAKLSLKSSLLAGTLSEDSVTESYLVGYFPPAATVAAGSDNLSAHPLRREIITCELTNDLVDLMGATFVYRLTRDTGYTAERVVTAWLVASRLADHRALISRMADQSTFSNARMLTRWRLELARVLERTTRWVLQNVESDASPAVIVDENLQGLADLRESFKDFVAGDDRRLFETRVKEIRELGADESFSERLIALGFLDQLLEVLEISRETETDPAPTAHAYYQASELFEVPWLRRRTFATAGEGQWEHRAAQVLSDDLSKAHRKLVVGAVSDGIGVPSRPGGGGVDFAELVSRQCGREVERFREIVEELKGEELVGLAAVSVAARELSALADRMGRGRAAERRR